MKFIESIQRLSVGNLILISKCVYAFLFLTGFLSWLFLRNTKDDEGKICTSIDRSLIFSPVLSILVFLPGFPFSVLNGGIIWNIVLGGACGIVSILAAISTVYSIRHEFKYECGINSITLLVLGIVHAIAILLLYSVLIINGAGRINATEKLPDGVKEIVITPEGNEVHIMEDGTEIIDITNGYAPTPTPKPTQVPESESEVDYITEEEYIREFLKPEYPTYTDLAYAYMELEDRIYNLEEEIMELEDDLEEYRGY